MPHRLAWALPLMLLATACGVGEGELGADDELETGGQELSTTQKADVVCALNRPDATYDALVSAAVTTRAARNLIEHRDGADHAFGTGDDNLFDSFAEVDAVSYVGSATLSRLAEFAANRGCSAASGGTWEGVSFTASEAANTLHLANSATLETLDLSVGLTNTAATRIVAARPISTMDALAAVPYVGTAALQALKAYANAGGVDLNVATAAQLESCAYVGPAVAAAIVDYRSSKGAFESYEELKALPSFGYSVIVSDQVVAGVRACTTLAGERSIKSATIAELLANPAQYDGAEVTISDAVIAGYISSSYTRSTSAFDFSAWSYADWYADVVPASAHVKLVVQPSVEMWRADSTTFTRQAATDTKLNRVSLTAFFQVLSGVPTLTVRSESSAGRDFIQVKQRWVTAASVKSLASMWSKENGVVRTTDGFFVNRIPAALLNVHPAVLFHEQQSGTQVDVGQYRECYDCTANPYTEDGQNLFGQYVQSWNAAGRP